MQGKQDIDNREHAKRERTRRGRTKEGKEKGEAREIREGRKSFKIGFWNIAGMLNKDKQFWDYIKYFDFIGLTETWIEEKYWKRMENRMPEEFNWKCQFAGREKSRGRACGALITGVKRNIIEIEVDERFRGLQERKVKIQGNIWRVITVYSKDMKKTRSNIEEMVEATKEERLLIGGDFNAKTGKRGSFCDEVAERESKDKVTNTEGVRLLEMVEKSGWEILNGNMEGDEEGEFTFIGAQGNSMIDYILIDTKIKEEIQNFRIEERVESDHLPMVVEIYGEVTHEKQAEEQGSEEGTEKMETGKVQEGSIHKKETGI